MNLTEGFCRAERGLSIGNVNKNSTKFVNAVQVANTKATSDSYSIKSDFNRSISFPGEQFCGEGNELSIDVN